MTRFPVSSSSEQCICAALEPSKNSWLLALQVPGRDNPNLYPITGGNAEGLMAKLDAARDRVPQVTGSDAEGDAVHRGGLRRLLVGAVPRATGYRVSGHGSGQLAGQAPGAPGTDRPHRVDAFGRVLYRRRRPLFHSSAAVRIGIAGLDQMVRAARCHRRDGRAALLRMLVRQRRSSAPVRNFPQ